MARRFLSVSIARRAIFQLSLLIVMSARASAVAGVAINGSVFEALSAALGDVLRAGVAPGSDSAFASAFGSAAGLSSLDSGGDSTVEEAGFSAPGFVASGTGAGLAGGSFFIPSPDVFGTASVAATSPVDFAPIDVRFRSPVVGVEGAGFDPLVGVADAGAGPAARATESADGAS